MDHPQPASATASATAIRAPQLSTRWQGFFHLGVIYVVWSSTYLAIRIAVRPGSGFPPFVMGGTRLLTAGILLLAWAVLKRQNLRLSRDDLIPLVASALLLWLGGNGLVTWAEQRAESVYAALLIGATPIWATVIESFLERKTPSLRLIVALAVGFSGLGVLTYPKLAHGTRADELAMLALVAASMSWATGSVMQRRRPMSTSGGVSAGYQSALGGLAFLVVALFVHEPRPAPVAEAWMAWGYLVLIGSVLAFSSFVMALRLLPIGVVMTYAYVNPVFGAVLGYLFLHEPITVWTVIGTVLLILGVAGVFHDRYR